MLAAALVVSPSSSWTLQGLHCWRCVLSIRKKKRVFQASWAINLLFCSSGRKFHARSRDVSVAWGTDDCMLQNSLDIIGGSSVTSSSSWNKLAAALASADLMSSWCWLQVALGLLELESLAESSPGLMLTPPLSLLEMVDQRLGVLGDAGVLARFDGTVHELDSLQCWGVWPGAHVTNHCHWGGNSIIHLILPTNGR